MHDDAWRMNDGSAKAGQPHGGNVDGTRARTNRADGGERADRAQQFMPFAALKGYYELVRQRERVVEPRHELTEEEAVALSQKIARIRRGMLITAVHYDGEAYVHTTGVVANVDVPFRTITVVKQTIAFADLVDIECD